MTDNQSNVEIDTLRKRIAPLEKRTETLEKKLSSLEDKIEQYTPRTDALMRQGVPLEIFSRQALIENGFEVFGLYPFNLHDAAPKIVERSVDIHALKDSTYTVPEGSSSRAGESWPERNHILAEIKQRRDGVEWIFSTLPTSNQRMSIAGDSIPIANTAFEIRHGENTRSGGNPNAVANAAAQLNQAYMPFKIGLQSGADIEWAGGSKRYALSKNRDTTWLLLITNAELKYFTPPANFSEMSETEKLEKDCFKSVPWVVYHDEVSVGLKYHQKQVFDAFYKTEAGGEEIENPSVEQRVLEKMSVLTHEIHVVDHRHLSEFLSLVNDPPRLQSVQISLSVDGQSGSTFSISM